VATVGVVDSASVPAGAGLLERAANLHRLETRQAAARELAVAMGAARVVAAGRKQAALELLREAAVRPTPRRATKPTAGSRERRLQSKKRRSSIKGLRQGKPALE